MIMSNILKSRKSVRDFKSKPLRADILERVKDAILEIEAGIKLGNIKFKFYENGDYIYKGLKGLGGYAGVMIESPHYIAMDMKNRKDSTIIYAAYNMEKLITKLNDIGISTCWISLNDVDESKKKELLGDQIHEVDYLLAIGYAKPRNPFVQEPFSERLGVEELVFDGKLGEKMEYDELENRGLGDLFFYLRFAPSTKNEQPWRFIVHDDKVQLLLAYKDGEEPLLADAGVAMYYLEALGNVQGINSNWRKLELSERVDDINYKYVAEYDL